MLPQLSISIPAFSVTLSLKKGVESTPPGIVTLPIIEKSTNDLFCKAFPLWV